MGDRPRQKMEPREHLTTGVLSNYDMPAEQITYCCRQIVDTPWGKRRTAFREAMVAYCKAA
jgi:hypothetical protein